LDSLLVQRLLDSGFAVILEARPQDLAIRLSGDREQVQVHVQSATAHRERRLAVPDPCDSTFGLDLSEAMAALIQEVAAVVPPVPRPPEPLLNPEAASSPPARWALAVTTLWFPNQRPLAGLAAIRQSPLSPRLQVHWGVALEVGYVAALTLLEPSLEAELQWLGALDFGTLGIGPSAAVSWPSYHDAHGFGGNLDGRVGVAASLTVHRWALCVIPHLRWVPLSHEVQKERVFATGRFGLDVRFSYLLGPRP